MKFISQIGYICDSSISVTMRNIILKTRIANTDFPISTAKDLLDKFNLSIELEDNCDIKCSLINCIPILTIGKYAIVSSSMGAKLIKTCNSKNLFTIRNNMLQVVSERKSIEPNETKYFVSIAKIKAGYNLTLEESDSFSVRLFNQTRKRGYI